ncbi:hypothetical protein ACWEFL_35815 [Streptomyces sp. NPDC004838]
MGISKDELKRRPHLGEVDSGDLLELLCYLTGGCPGLKRRRSRAARRSR